MIHETELDARTFQLAHIVLTVIDRLNSFLPNPWPPFAAEQGGFFTDEAYERGGNTGHGAGLSRHVTVAESFVDWLDTYEQPATDWMGFDAAELFAAVEGFAWGDDLFRAFNPGLAALRDAIGLLKPPRQFDRDEWKAGSLDREAMDEILRDFAARLRRVLEQLDELLTVEQLGESTFILISKVWQWQTYTQFPEETLEVLPGLFADNPDSADHCDHVEGNLPERIWDGFAAEQLAKRDLAQDLILTLAVWRDGEGTERDLAEQLSTAVHIWHEGSQTRRRGP